MSGEPLECHKKIKDADARVEAGGSPEGLIRVLGFHRNSHLMKDRPDIPKAA